MTFKEIQDLIKLVSKSNLSEFKLTTEKVDLTIRTEAYNKGGKGTPQFVSMPPQQIAAPAQPVAAPAPPAASPAKTEAKPASDDTSNLLEVRSPIVGTFYRSSGPDKPPFKKVGDTVAIGDVVCIVEAMKLFNEIESEVAGTIVQVLVEDSSPVEYDQVLFLVDPS